MKTYEQMASNVFRRAKEYRMEKKRKSERMLKIVFVGAVCIFAFSVLSFLFQDGNREGNNLKLSNTIVTETQTQGTEVNETSIAEASQLRAKLLLADGSKTQTKELLESLLLPYHYHITVRDIRGLDESQMDAVWADAEAEFETMKQTYGNTELFGYGNTKDENILLTEYTAGAFVLDIDDYESVADITLQTTDAGSLRLYLPESSDFAGTFLDKPVHVSGEDIQINYSDKYYGVTVYWGLSHLSLNALKEQPDMALSALTDTLQITVNYKDGTVLSYTVDIIFDDSGEAFAINRGVSAST